MLRALLPIVAALALAVSAGAQNLTVDDVLKLPVAPADHRIAYGAEPLQFGDLRLPKGRGPHPVAIVIHGGCWLAKYNLDPVSQMCAALTRAGMATWSLEYRRVGDAGAGWPGTFNDVSRGADHLRQLAGKHRLDLKRVAVVGHSAGGHLALWLAARRRLPKDSPLYAANPLPLRGVVCLAGVTDLRRAATSRLCGDAVPQLMGGPPDEVAERYRQASPIELVPLGLPQHLINGARDRIVPLDYGRDYEAAARKLGADVRLTVLDQAAHFELVVPGAAEWAIVEKAVLAMLR